MNSRLLMTIAGLCLLIPAWLGLLSAGVPTLYCPFPILTILPAFWLYNSGLFQLAILTPPVAFFLWTPDLLWKRRTGIPARTIVLLALLTILAVVDGKFEWSYGLRYQGAHHTIAIYVINAVWLGILWWAVVRFVRGPSFIGNVLLHWLPFAWLGWYAFPYLGELPWTWYVPRLAYILERCPAVHMSSLAGLAPRFRLLPSVETLGLDMLSASRTALNPRVEDPLLWPLRVRVPRSSEAWAGVFAWILIMNSRQWLAYPW